MRTIADAAPRWQVSYIAVRLEEECSDVDAPANDKPDKDKQHEYQPNGKRAKYSGAKGESQSSHPLCFVRHFPECDDAA